MYPVSGNMSSPSPGSADGRGMNNKTNDRDGIERPHHLDALIWDADRWCEQFEHLLEAVEFQLALEDWLADDAG